MINQKFLKQRISKAEEYIEFLENVKKDYRLEEFQSNKMVYGSSERFLHLTIEVLIDIGNYIIAGHNLGRVESYSDIPKLLAENNFLDNELKKLFAEIIGFRNTLVRNYSNIDLEIVYSIISNNLVDLKEILKVFVQVKKDEVKL